jgi:Na+-driven multidrug efflux pump
MVFAFLGFIVFRSAFAYALAVPGGFGATGVWYGEALANVLMALAVAGYFSWGRWDGRVIDDDAAASA